MKKFLVIIVFLGIYGFINRHGGAYTQDYPMQNELLQENVIEIVEEQRENKVEIEEIAVEEQEKTVIKEMEEIKKSENKTVIIPKTETENVSPITVKEEKQENVSTQETKKLAPTQEQTNQEKIYTENSVEIELDQSTKFDIDDGGYAEWGHLTEEQMKALGF